MTETLLTLIPVYGLWLVFCVVALSCLAIPLPASAVVLAAGGFSAAKDLVLWQVVAAAFLGFALGDQIAFQIGRRYGTPLLARFRRLPRMARPMARAERLVSTRGAAAVFASRTVLSPLGPYMSYLSGAGGLPWQNYSTAAMPGAALWAVGYALLGYGAAHQLAQSTELLWNGLVALAALGSGAAAALWLAKAAKAYRAQHPPSPAQKA